MSTENQAECALADSPAAQEQQPAVDGNGPRTQHQCVQQPGAASAALAACPSTSRVQGCMLGTPVSGWSDTCIHSRRRPTRYGQRSPSATLSRSQDMSRSTDAQLQRSKLQCCRPTRVEQFTAAPVTRHELRAFQASTENILFRS